MLTDEAKLSFEKLKNALSTAPVLAQPDFSREFVIQCDASKVGVGGVLFQLDDFGKEHPIAFISQKLNKCQRNYTVTELECMAAVICVNRFRPYIEGLPFRIITDHASLKWLMSQKDLSGRLARWSLKLQRYDFKIEHRKGSLNIVPDVLSRMDLEEIAQIDIPHDIDLETPDFQSDEYRKIIDLVSTKRDCFPDLYLSDEGLVYKRIDFRQNCAEEGNLWRLWIPNSMSAKILKAAHDTPTACHGGFTKTLARVRQKYFWPTMVMDVKEYVNNCETCKTIKSSNRISKPPMGNQFATNRPFERLYCDFLGPYPHTKVKNSVIFVCLDHFTKYIFLRPLKAATSAGVISYFQNEIFPTFGVPRFIHSDNGKQFVSKEMVEFFCLYDIQHIKTGFYAPQSNASERVNREILTKIRFFLKDHKSHGDWDRFIPQILSILRSDYHSSIKCSPYYACFGQNMIQHGSTYKILDKLGCLAGEDCMILSNADTLQKVRSTVRKNLTIAHEKASKTYNLRTRPIQFKKGEIVFRKNHVLSNMPKAVNRKFLSKFIKCRIKEKIGNNLYDIEDLNGVYVGRYHASDLKS